jgi:CRP/FNR family cyclic AMP-dependent transcriptional regulator
MSSITKESFKAGEFIFFEGDIESHFYIIESGEVLIFTKDQKGGKIEIARLKEGETFGEFALIDKGTRSASAQAITDTKAMKISSEGYELMLEDLPLWASSMLRSFSHRLKHMNTTLKEIKNSLNK